MTLPFDRIYRKTERGQVALSTRSAVLTARGRTALILVNGRESLAALDSKLGGDAAALVSTLLELGLVDEVPSSPEPLRASVADIDLDMPAAPAAPAPNPLAASSGPGEPLARLLPLKRAAVQRLAPQFGPDVQIICRALLEAGSDETYRAALEAIEAKLAIYLGRKDARRLLDGLWP